MKILKYILLASILFILWVTEPLWFKKSYNTNTTPTDTFITEQDQERKKLLKDEAAKLKALEDKFGPKPSVAYGTRIPHALSIYWGKTLKYPDSLEEERCEPVRPGARGWQIVCRYRVKNHIDRLELRQDTYIIKDGVILK
ncbi:MAG: hypothetical protein DRG09_00785 [Epsilonproteobacteria bacterium]|nr:MAG: hypothetical protein DRG09_00785 [Campylobacterota bacterium]